MISRIKQFAPLVVALALAAGTGFLAAQALGTGALVPQKTVTVNVATGPEGPPGPPGPGITMKGTVATVADLPTTGNKQGDTYIVSSDGSMQIWDGTKWVSGGPVGGGGTGGEGSCPAGSTFGKLVINQPGGHVDIYTCIVD